MHVCRPLAGCFGPVSGRGPLILISGAPVQAFVMVGDGPSDGPDAVLRPPAVIGKLIFSTHQSPSVNDLAIWSVRGLVRYDSSDLSRVEMNASTGMPGLIAEPSRAS